MINSCKHHILTFTLLGTSMGGVPFELMTEDTRRDIGNTMGNFVEMDKRSW